MPSIKAYITRRDKDKKQTTPNNVRQTSSANQIASDNKNAGPEPLASSRPTSIREQEERVQQKGETLRSREGSLKEMNGQRVGSVQSVKSQKSCATPRTPRVN